MRKIRLAVLAVCFALAIPMAHAAEASAAQGCGFGYHRGFAGECKENRPGPNAGPVVDGCWLNGAGHRRCYPNLHRHVG